MTPTTHNHDQKEREKTEIRTAGERQEGQSEKFVTAFLYRNVYYRNSTSSELAHLELLT